jgi:hypothetical protein
LPDAKAFAASSAVFTMGTMTAIAPASSTLPMIPGSFHGTRTVVVDPPSVSACNMGTLSE